MSKKQTNTKENEKETEILGRIISRMYFLLTMIVLPLYYTSMTYVELIEAKGQCFLGIALATTIGIVLYYLYGFLSGQYKIYGKFDWFVPMDYVVLGLGVVLLLSFLTSGDLEACLWGTHGFRVGAMSYGAVLIFYFFVSRHLRSVKDLWLVVFVVTDLICIWGFMNNIGIDVMSMHEIIVEYQFYSYISTLGNVDSVSAYISIMLPVAIVFFVNEKEIKREIFFLVTSALIMLMLVTFRSDGVLFGLLFFSVVFAVHAITDRKRLAKSCLVVGIFGAEMIFFKVLSIQRPYEVVIDTSNLINKLASEWAGVPIAIAGFILFLLFTFIKKEFTAKAFKIVGYVYSVVVSVWFIQLAIRTLSSLEASFGSARGSIWMGAFDLFKEYNLKEKLIGAGPVMIRERLTPLAVARGSSASQNYATCHDGILEVLLEFGVIGLLLTIALWVVLLVPYFKNFEKWTVERIAYLCSAFAYLGQSLVGNPYSLSVPLFLTMLILCRDQIYLEQKKERESTGQS